MNREKRLQDPLKREQYLKAHRERSARDRAIKGPEPKEEVQARVKRFYEKNRHKQLAHRAVRNAIRNKVLLREPCRECGETLSEAHHEDYSKPLEVIWLCKRHHHDLHLKQNMEKRLAEKTNI